MCVTGLVRTLGLLNSENLLNVVRKLGLGLVHGESVGVGTSDIVN